MIVMVMLMWVKVTQRWVPLDVNQNPRRTGVRTLPVSSVCAFVSTPLPPGQSSQATAVSDDRTARWKSTIFASRPPVDTRRAVQRGRGTCPATACPVDWARLRIRNRARRRKVEPPPERDRPRRKQRGHKPPTPFLPGGLLRTERARMTAKGPPSMASRGPEKRISEKTPKPPNRPPYLNTRGKNNRPRSQTERRDVPKASGCDDDSRSMMHIRARER
eukprot:1930418-Pyramimonas_sp.AAC.1